MSLVFWWEFILTSIDDSPNRHIKEDGKHNWGSTDSHTNLYKNPNGFFNLLTRSCPGSQHCLDCAMSDKKVDQGCRSIIVPVPIDAMKTTLLFIIDRKEIHELRHRLQMTHLTKGVARISLRWARVPLSSDFHHLFVFFLKLSSV